MAPEQVIGKHEALGPAVDIYALGAILYEMLTGRPPFRGESTSETERQVLTDEPIPPSRLNPKVPRDLGTICLKCLQKDPSRRYATAADLAADVDRFLSGKPIVARPVGVAERAVKWTRRRPALASLVATLLLALAGAIALGARIQRQENTCRIEMVLREGRARQAIETALSLVIDLRRSERWVEAEHIIQDARSRLAEANSPPLQARLDRVAADLGIAEQLEEIRQSYAAPNVQGYNYYPAAAAYSELLVRIGAGPEVSPQTAATLVSASPIREQLLAGLDNAAFVAHVLGNQAELERLLAVARLADSEESWEHRFRDPEAWRSRGPLLKLVEDARFSAALPASHQLGIVGMLLNGVGANTDTIKLLRDALYRNPGDFWLNLELAHALRRAGRSPEACQYYRAALAVRPTNFVVWTTLGVVLQDAGESDEAILAHRKATDLNPRYLLGWSNLIIGLVGAGRWTEADAARRKASEINPDFTDPPRAIYVNRIVLNARAHSARKEWHAAADAYAAAIKMKLEDDSDVWFEYAAVQLLSGHRDDHRSACQHMLKRGEEGAMRPFLVARACTLALCTNEDRSRAAELSSDELRQADSEHWSLTEQGAICYRFGRFGDAVPLLERSIAANNKPGAAVLNWFWLAMAHDKLGHADEARRCLEKATSWIDQLGPEIPPHPETLSFHLHTWLEAQILRHEAAEAMEK